MDSYYDKGTKECGKCHLTCQTCKNGNGSDKCTTCDAALFRAYNELDTVNHTGECACTTHKFSIYINVGDDATC